MDRKNILNPKQLREEVELDLTLRPQHLEEFIGQNKIKEKLDIFLKAAKIRKEPLEHILFYGPPGLGKTTLAYVISNEMETRLHPTSGPILERPADLAGILTKLDYGDILFIDELHRINRVVEEYLYPAMEDFKLDIMIDSGPNARSLKINLKPFTLIGATTRAGKLTGPLRSRFGMDFRIDYYDSESLKDIVLRSARLLNVDINNDSAQEISKRSRGTPRIANRLLRRVRDYAQVKADGKIVLDITIKALELLEVDSYGLDEMDKRILLTIIQKHGGGPVGINTIAVAVGEEPDTIEEVYEPYLIQIGFLARTPRGRVVTPLAYNHLFKSNNYYKTIFD